MEITGFLIVRDVAANGYPFVEATHSMMAVCPVVHVLDGESTDTTWDVLLQLRDICGSGRLVLHREPWREIAGRHPFRSATNQLREKIKGEWLFNFQANEILHEDSAPGILDLAALHPVTELFRLPYLHAMGTHYVSSTDRRGRLFQDLPHYECLGDAFDFGIDFNFTRPWRTLLLLPKRRRLTAASLRRPIYRMRAPCPESYVAKIRSQTQLYPSDPHTRAERESAETALRIARENGDSIDAFWERIRFGRMSDDATETGPSAAGGERIPIPEDRLLKNLPAVLNHLVGSWKYDPQAALETVASLGVPSPQ